MTNIFKKHFVPFAFFFALSCFYLSQAQAQCPTTNPQDEPVTAGDTMNTSSDSATTQQLKTEDEKQKEAIKGNANCEASPQKTPEIETTAYDYIKEKVLASTKTDPILKPQNNFADAIKEIKTTFFTSNKKSEGIIGGSVTSSEINAALQKRMDYVHQVSSEALTIAKDLRGRIEKDAKSIANAQTKGCNIQQGYALQNRNLRALIKGTTADIVIQVLIMESTAAHNLLKEPSYLINLEEAPSSEKTSYNQKNPLWTDDVSGIAQHAGTFPQTTPISQTEKMQIAHNFIGGL